MSFKVTSLPVNPTTFLLKFTGLTDGGEDTCEAEIVHSIEREQVEQKLLPFFLTEQERMRFIQLSVRGGMKKQIKRSESCYFL